MDVKPVTLQGRTVRMEPLSSGHAAPLMQAAEPEIFTYMWGKPANWTVEGFRAYVQSLVATPDMRPFAVILRDSGQPVGVTTYMEIRPAHRGLEIGSTWLARPYQGTCVNPECKYLLLRYAFESLGAVRVQLKTDRRNLHSQAAIAKLGAKREGVLRKHVILPDGYIRDTVMFSITDEDWPQIKAGLQARLGYVPGT